MNARSDAQFESMLERWAYWAESGQTHRQNVTHFLKTRGNRGFGSRDLGHDGIESRIESAVSQLALQDITAATVVRANYSRRHTQHTQLDIALALGISLRTFERKLQKAKQHIKEVIQWQAR